jgi:hypothetical protein
MTARRDDRGGRAMNRPAETTEDFKLRIAAMIGEKTEHIAGARRPNPMLVRKCDQIRS